MKSLVVALALSGGAASAQDGGASEEGLVLEVISGVVTVPSGAVRSVDTGVFLDELAAVRSARELAELRAEVRAWRSQPRPVAATATPTAYVVTALVCLAAGFVGGVLITLGP